VIAWSADLDEDEARRFVEHVITARDPVLLVRTSGLAATARELLALLDRPDIPIKISRYLPEGDTIWVLDQAYFHEWIWADPMPAPKWINDPPSGGRLFFWPMGL